MFLPEIGKFAVAFESGETVLLSEAEIRERVQRAALHEVKLPETVRRAPGRRWRGKGKLGDDPFVVEVGRNSVRRLHDLAVEAVKKVDVLDGSAVVAVADHLWAGAALWCRADIGGRHLPFATWNYLAAGAGGLPAGTPWEEARPRFRAAVEKAMRTARKAAMLSADPASPYTGRYGGRERPVDPRLRRGKAALANDVVRRVLKEFGKELFERSLHEIRRKYPSPVPFRSSPQ